jgi:pyruvate dehydrogenase (quinone)/pyruvate oxidase
MKQFAPHRTLSFGIPGDGINGLIESFRQKQDRVRFVQVRHEEAAAFMACGYAKFTGKLGVCIATSGPGGIHLLNGHYDAKLDGQPVLAITGLQFHDLLHTHTQQDVELDKLFMDVCVYNTRVMGPAHVENVVACRTALADRAGCRHTERGQEDRDLGRARRSACAGGGDCDRGTARRAAVPLTAALVIICEHFRSTEWIARLLSSHK